MFSFTACDNPVIEAHVKWDEAVEKYSDSVVVTVNGHPENKEVLVDIVAILTPQEYALLEKPKDMSARFAVLLGKNLAEEEINSGFSPLYWQTRDWDLIESIAAGKVL